MKKIIMLFIIMAFISGCDLKDANVIIGEDARFKFDIEENRNLVIKDGDKSLYVSSNEGTSEFSHGKDIVIIMKNEEGNFSIEKDFSKTSGISAMVNGVDIEKKLIEINGKIYKLESDNANALDLNTLFTDVSKDGKLILNKSNYEEFIDDGGNLYIKGDEITEDEAGMFLYPVNLNGEDIYSITFDKRTGEIYGTKEKALMLADGSEADNIETINYVGIYQGEGYKSVQIDEKYYKLIIK